MSIKYIDSFLGGMKRDPFFIVGECQVVYGGNEQRENKKQGVGTVLPNACLTLRGLCYLLS